MLPSLACLALATTSVMSWQVGLASEGRGIAGIPAGVRVLEPSAFQLSPFASAELQSDRLRLGAFYGSHFLLAPGRSDFWNPDRYGVYHDGTLSLGWRPDSQWTVKLATSASRGLLEVSPLAQAQGGGGTPPGTTTAPGGGLVPDAGVRVAPFFSVSVTGAADVQATRVLATGASSTYYTSGGLTTAARNVFPEQWGVRGEGHLGLAVSRLDEVGAQAGASHSSFPGDHRIDLVEGLARWRHKFSDRVNSEASAGLAVRWESVGGPGAGTTYGVLPSVLLYLTQAPPKTGPAVDYTLALRLAPFIDTYSVGVVQRVETQLVAGWAPRGWVRLTGSILGATVVSSRRIGPNTAVCQTGVELRGTSVDLGLLVRGGWEEKALPAFAPWQWGVSLTATWHGKTSL